MGVLGFATAGSCHRSAGGAVVSPATPWVTPRGCSAAALPVPRHGSACSQGRAGLGWAGVGMQRLGRARCPWEAFWVKRLLRDPSLDHIGPFLPRRTCPLQGLHNHLTAGMRGSRTSWLSPGCCFSRWDFLASFHLKSLWARRRACNLGCPPAQRSQPLPSFPARSLLSFFLLSGGLLPDTGDAER